MVEGEKRKEASKNGRDGWRETEKKKMRKDGGKMNV